MAQLITKGVGNTRTGGATRAKMDALKERYGSLAAVQAVAVDRLWREEQDLQVIFPAGKDAVEVWHQGQRVAYFLFNGDSPDSLANALARVADEVSAIKTRGE